MVVSFKQLPLAAHLFLTFLVVLLLFKPRFEETSPLLSTPSTLYSTEVFDKENPFSPFDFSIAFPLRPAAGSPGIPSVLVLVTTTASESKMRDAVRSSWANYSSDAVKVQFLMGRPTTKQLIDLTKENGKWKDLVVANIDDGYYSLAGKTMAMLVYKDKFYPETKCLVKADIDNVLMLRNYETLCEKTLPPVILGKCDVPRTVFRNGSKWSVPEYVFPEPLYPVYCSTGSYVLAGKSVPRLLISEAMRSAFANSFNFRKLPEDVIFTGILPEKAGIPRRHVAGLSFVAIPEFFCHHAKKRMYSVHLLTEKDPVKNFNKLSKIDGTSCQLWE